MQNIQTNDDPTPSFKFNKERVNIFIKRLTKKLRRAILSFFLESFLREYSIPIVYHMTLE